MNYIVYLFARSFCTLIQVLPRKISIYFIYALIRFILIFLPKYKKIAYKNINTVKEYCTKNNIDSSSVLDPESTYKASLYNLARGIVDTATLPKINSEWIRKNVEFEDPDNISEIIKSSKNDSAIIASGHFGSFEILPRCLSEFLNKKGWFVARELKNKQLNDWWNKLRGVEGNSVITRTGAVRKMLNKLQTGETVGLLFDQNVTRNQAVFVDWFGVKAATTQGLAYIALQTRAPLIIVAIYSLPNNRYKIKAKFCKTDDLFSIDNIARDDKILLLTERASNIFQDMILEDPTGWFWLHRRWKTRPREEDIENFYT
jgi:KDO2-lipid IV(A) lauroyltransferase